MIARLAIIGFALALAACARYDSVVVVLPDADGGSGAVTIDDGTNKLRLDTPHAAGAVRNGHVRRVEAKPEDVRVAFAAAMAAQPILPARFQLYFQLDSERLTSDSETVLRDVLADIARRPAFRVEVIGHTDTRGDASYNRTLSLARAKVVAGRLMRMGIDRAAIRIAGRGERDLAVPTADDVAEPRNRRVEVEVR